MNLPQNVLKIFELLKDYETYLIGGCVRDMLWGAEVGDYDFSTQATPKEMQKIFHSHQIKTFDVGIEFGTLRVLLDDQIFEITTFRKEGGYKTFRKPSAISFASSLFEDIHRRDFTINAIAYHPESGLRDYCNGLQDIRDKILRCIGDPKDRFYEDALRILRAIGFVSRFGLCVESQTNQAIFQTASLLHHISKERITAEWEKILKGKNMYFAFKQYQEVFEVLFRKKLKLPTSHQPLIATAEILQDPDVLDLLQYPKKTKEEIKTYMQWLKKDIFLDKLSIKKALSVYPQNWVESFLSEKPEKQIILQEILENQEIFQLKDLAINGSDLLCFRPERRKEILESALLKVMKGEITNERKSLLSFLRKNQESKDKS